MYKVFLVEDEHLIRASLKKQLQKLATELPITCVGEAGDGEMALAELIEKKPDILLTDIKMPFMDGIQLAHEAKKRLPQLRIIFISGFDEFTYAKAAIQLQADEYLLKPIKFQELKETLQKTTTSLDQQKAHSTGQKKQQDVLSLEVKKNLFLNLLFKGSITLADAIKGAEDLQREITGKKYLVILATNPLGTQTGDYYPFSDKLNQIFGEDQTMLFSSISSRFIKFLLFDQKEASLAEKARQVAQELVDRLELPNDAPITIAIGNPVERLSEIPFSYQTARQLLTYDHEKLSRQVIDYQDFDQEKTTAQRQAQLLSQLEETSLVQLGELVTEFTQVLNHRPQKQYIYRLFLLLDLNELAKQKQNYGQIQLIDNNSRLASIAADDIAFQRYLDKVLHFLKELSINPNMMKHQKLLNRVLAYLDQNYNTPDFSLQDAADHVNLSPSHFSTIFSQALGKTFVEYLTERRLAEGKRLLRTTDWKLATIATEIGYNDPNYFSYIFKRKELISPKEYRKQAWQKQPPIEQS